MRTSPPSSAKRRTELLEQSDAAFGRWRADRADRAQVTELKRLLHTLKGGARMAGIRAMGDLSHEVESFLAAIESGASPGDAEALNVLQSALDELYRMRELANSGQHIPPARDLMQRIRALTAGGVEVAPAPVATPEPVAAVVVPAAPAAEPVEAPEPAADVPAPEEEPDLVAELPFEEIVLETPAPDEFAPGADATAAAVAPEVPEQVVVEELPLVAEELFVESLPEVVEEVVLETPAAAEVEAEFAEIFGAEPEAEPTAEPAEPAATLPPAPLPELPLERMPELPAAVARFVVPEPPQVAPTFETAATAQPVLPGREPTTPVERAELARVDADLLDDLLNNAGEVSIFRARIEQQMTSIEFNLAELDRTVTRLREQLRKLEMETEAQILHRHQADDTAHRADFDPLELDRYSSIQQLSRALAESVSDVGQHRGPAGAAQPRDAEPAAAAGPRRHRGAERPDAHAHGAVPASRAAADAHCCARSRPRPARRPSWWSKAPRASSTGRCSSACCRRSSTCCATPWCTASRRRPSASPSASPRRAASRMSLQREGAEVVITVEDDGAGLNVEAIRAKARQMGLLQPGMELTDEEALQLILEPGFSTADRLTQQAGRGVGMDVVATEVKKLGGALYIESTPRRGHALHHPPAVHAGDHARR